MKQSGKAPKPLIVCYSYSGNTLALAQKIQRLTGAALTQVFPTQPYPSRFEELLVQVRRELRGRHYPKLLPVSEPPTDYDMIFVGSPNWCGTIAPPLASWLRQHNGLAVIQQGRLAVHPRYMLKIQHKAGAAQAKAPVGT